MKICMITYMRKGETLTPHLVNVVRGLRDCFQNDVKVVFCAEEFTQVINLHNICHEFFLQEGTKYARLRKYIQQDDSEYYLCIDNDIRGNNECIQPFLLEMIRCKYDLGWGKIAAENSNRMVGKLVAIDKILSHYILRPLLWKFRIGISIPGQLFCLKGSFIRDHFMQYDTYLDDLAIGLYAREKKCRILCSKNILGYELPNETFCNLLLQRKRWAIGFSSVFFNHHDFIAKMLLCIHMFSYHFLWCLNLLVCVFLFIRCVYILPIYILFNALLLTYPQKRLLLYGIEYQFVFPILHLYWFVFFLMNKKRCLHV